MERNLQGNPSVCFGLVEVDKICIWRTGNIWKFFEMHFILYNSNNKDNNGNISIYHNKNDEDYLSKKKKNWQGQRLQWRQLHELYFARCAFKEKEKKNINTQLSFSFYATSLLTKIKATSYSPLSMHKLIENRNISHGYWETLLIIHKSSTGIKETILWSILYIKKLIVSCLILKP